MGLGGIEPPKKTKFGILSLKLFVSKNNLLSIKPHFYSFVTQVGFYPTTRLRTCFTDRQWTPSHKLGQITKLYGILDSNQGFLAPKASGNDLTFLIPYKKSLINNHLDSPICGGKYWIRTNNLFYLL